MNERNFFKNKHPRQSTFKTTTNDSLKAYFELRMHHLRPLDFSLLDSTKYLTFSNYFKRAYYSPLNVIYGRRSYDLEISHSTPGVYFKKKRFHTHFNLPAIKGCSLVSNKSSVLARIDPLNTITVKRVTVERPKPTRRRQKTLQSSTKGGTQYRMNNSQSEQRLRVYRPLDTINTDQVATTKTPPASFPFSLYADKGPITKIKSSDNWLIFNNDIPREAQHDNKYSHIYRNYKTVRSQSSYGPTPSLTLSMTSRSLKNPVHGTSS